MTKEELNRKALQYAEEKVNCLKIRNLTINEIKKIVKAAYKAGYTQALNEDDNGPSSNEDLLKRTLWPPDMPLIAPNVPSTLPIRWDRIPPITCTYTLP